MLLSLKRNIFIQKIYFKYTSDFEHKLINLESKYTSVEILQLQVKFQTMMYHAQDLFGSQIPVTTGGFEHNTTEVYF